MDNYKCKIGNLDDMNKKWDYEIERHPGDISWKTYKDKFIDSFNKGNRTSYYGVLNDKIICETTAIINKEEVPQLKEIMDDNTAYLCAFRTIKEYEGKGYFRELYNFMEQDLKRRGYTKLALGVEPSEVRNIQIYFKLGFTNYIKTDNEEYEKSTEDGENEKAIVNYYYKEI